MLATATVLVGRKARKLLRTHIKMKRIGYLYEKICSMENLRLAHKNASKGKGWYAEVEEINKDP